MIPPNPAQNLTKYSLKLGGDGEIWGKDILREPLVKSMKV